MDATHDISGYLYSNPGLNPSHDVLLPVLLAILTALATRTAAGL
jgi:hypothetical protein